MSLHKIENSDNYLGFGLLFTDKHKFLNATYGSGKVPLGSVFPLVSKNAIPSFQWIKEVV